MQQGTLIKICYVSNYFLLTKGWEVKNIDWGEGGVRSLGSCAKALVADSWMGMRHGATRRKGDEQGW